MQALDKSNNGVHYKTIAQQLKISPLYENEDIERLASKIAGCLNRGAKSTNGLFAQVSNGKKNKDGKFGHKAGVYKLRPPKREKDVINPDKHKAMNKTASSDTLTLFQIEDNKPRVPKTKKTSNISVNPITIKPFGDDATQSQIGKGGEFAVMSELLYRGYYANSTAVDNGIDIIAYRDNNVFLIQVKTTGIECGDFKYSINKESFERYSKANIFYIFVMRYIENGKPVSQYLVFPSSSIRLYIDTKLISETTSKTYEVKFRVQGSKIFLKNKGAEFDIAQSNLNRFDLIE